jgi:hypothetical protein
MTNAISSGRSLTKPLVELPPSPTTVSTASIPTSCSATYGIVARMPVTATARLRPEEPYLPRTKSAGVT